MIKSLQEKMVLTRLKLPLSGLPWVAVCLAKPSLVNWVFLKTRKRVSNLRKIKIQAPTGLTTRPKKFFDHIIIFILLLLLT